MRQTTTTRQSSTTRSSPASPASPASSAPGRYEELARVYACGVDVSQRCAMAEAAGRKEAGKVKAKRVAARQAKAGTRRVSLPVGWSGIRAYRFRQAYLRNMYLCTRTKDPARALSRQSFLRSRGHPVSRPTLHLELRLLGGGAVPARPARLAALPGAGACVALRSLLRCVVRARAASARD